MIPARKTSWFNAWFAGVCRKKIEDAFEIVHVRGLEHVRAASAEGPLLCASNHTAWWDPLVAIYATNTLAPVDAYALMDAKNLRALPFFARVGAFGVDPGEPRDGALAIRYAAKLLDGPKKLVWVFPQGRERPITERPLGFRGGAAEIARVARCATLPVALRYEHGGHERPELWISVGVPVPPARDVDALRAAQEAAVTAELDAIDAAIRAGTGFAVHHRRPAQSDWATRVLAELTRGHVPPPTTGRPGR